MTLLESFFPDLTSRSTCEYNVVKTNDTELKLEMNVCGMTQEDVIVEVVGDLLIISTISTEDDKHYVYRGFSHPKFVQKFKLRDDIVVKSGRVKDGLLSIDLEIQVPEHKKPRKLLLTH